MTLSELSLPKPSSEALSTSDRLREIVVERIHEAGGWISFEDYMQMVLYEPGLGYYSAGSIKIGPSGDFVTAPEISPFFGHSIARFALEHARHLGCANILELGAGTGRLAAQVLETSAASGARDLRYQIIEPSADLRQRQQGALAEFSGAVSWLTQLPSAPFDGLILANEVIDALPVIRFAKSHGTARELGVRCRSGEFVWARGESDPSIEREVTAIESRIDAPFADGYESELRRILPPWLKTLHSVLGRGAVLLIDYGLVRREYYHPQRSAGTLICHYRQRAHQDPFVYPGLQDISAWVDFSACAEAAMSAGFDVAGFTTQAAFVMNAVAAAGATALAASTLEDLSALKTLVLPGEMGERFKLMLLTKNSPQAKLGGRDYRRWL